MVDNLKIGAHQKDIKELVEMKVDGGVDSRQLHLGKKVVLEHTAESIDNGQQTCKFFAWVRDKNCPQQQMTVVCICH